MEIESGSVELVDSYRRDKQTNEPSAPAGVIEHHQPQLLTSDTAKVATKTDGEWILPLCVSHAAAAWGERSWEFGAGLLFLRLSQQDQAGENLRLTACLVFAESIASSLLGPTIGRIVDRMPLINSAVTTLAVQNVGIAAAAVFFVLAFGWKRAPQDDDGNHNEVISINSWKMKVGAFLSIVCSVLANLGSLGSTIAIEKRWATELAMYGRNRSYSRLDMEDPGEIKGDVAPLEEADHPRISDSRSVGQNQNNTLLSRVNAILRSIDLTCNLCAPILVGFLLDCTASPVEAALWIAVFNLAAFPLETICCLWIHNHFTYSHVLSRGISDLQIAAENCDTEQKDDCGDDFKVSSTKYVSLSWCNEYCNFCEGWALYWRQKALVRSALGLAVLFFSVVGFGPLMTAWITSLGVRVSYVGIARAFAALSGLLATVAAPRWIKASSLRRAGVRFIWWMWLCILPVVIASFFLISSSFNEDGVRRDKFCVWIVIIGVICSRFGLWGYDLVITQMLQEWVQPPDKVGTINGIQESLQNLFDAMAALICVWVSNPHNFVWMILCSFGAITTTAILHTFSASPVSHRPL